jgi:2-methylcitrate dehydratase PrpD
VKPVVDPAIRPEQVALTVVLKDGRSLPRRIEHAIGSVERPMSDAALETKFTDLADGILPEAQVRRVMDLCWHIAELPNAGDVARAGVQA